MAESKIKTFLSLGSLQREILEEARRYECLGQALIIYGKVVERLDAKQVRG